MSALSYSVAVAAGVLLGVGLGAVLAALWSSTCVHDEERDVEGWLR